MLRRQEILQVVDANAINGHYSSKVGHDATNGGVSLYIFQVVDVNGLARAL